MFAAVVGEIRCAGLDIRPACDQRTGCIPSVLGVEHGDVRDADDRALRRLQPGNRLTPRFLARWMQQFVSGLLEFLCCRTHCRCVPNVEFDAELRQRTLRRPLRSAKARLGGLG